MSKKKNRGTKNQSRTQSRGETSTANTNQHYVPQTLLRGFRAQTKTEQVWVLDKKIDKVFLTSISSIAAKHGYYNHQRSADLDALMNRLDDDVSPVLMKIRGSLNTSSCSPEDLLRLAQFIAMQMVRTPAHREFRRRTITLLNDAVYKAFALAALGVEVVSAPTESEESDRGDYLESLPRMAALALPSLLDKDMFLLRAEGNSCFQISDNPVVLDNTSNPGDGVRGTIGYGVRGIEIYMPISAHLCLLYLCKTVSPGLQLCFRDALLSRQAVVINDLAVRYLNSLQFFNSERIVIASTNDFSDARDSLREHPEARIGRQIGRAG